MVAKENPRKERKRSRRLTNEYLKNLREKKKKGGDER